MTLALLLLLLLFALALAVFALGMSIRNNWVFNRLMELNRFEGDEHAIRRYVDYDTMMRRFWVWDVEKLKLPNAPVQAQAAKRPVALEPVVGPTKEKT